ncbi:MAG: PSD1 domain-containing protein [Verrucomicrobia bacterium]|nr:PSD1 domain-containing protein [Verrucomicrobiota bacterium]
MRPTQHRLTWRKCAHWLTLLPLGLLLGRTTQGEDFAFFESRIRPLLIEDCYPCHSAKAEQVKGDLRLDTKAGLLKGGTRGAVVVPSDPARSPLIQAARADDSDLRLGPGQDGHKKLSDDAIADLTKWVNMGAPYPDSENSDLKSQILKPHWAFQPVRNPPLPNIENKAWPRTSLDRFILAKIEERGLQPAPQADKRTLLRRATFDLIGLPPTPEEMDSFVADNSPDAYARAVDRLLNSPRYGERWGRHWLDVVRYADTAGETADYPVPVAWRYRNYVIDAFNADKPYDEFLREQIAGDILARRGPRERYAERVTATGYLAISRRFGFDSENYHHLTIQDTIDTLGQTVLGLSLGCARCHDHKYDPIAMGDYYALYGIFESTRYAFPGSEQKQKHRALVPLLPPEESQPKWREFDALIGALARKLESQKQLVPPAVLRSLDELDGDFELQAVAAGGSKGVLVPPWVYDGKLSVTKEAQSPFKNLHALGKVGVSVPAGTNAYRLAQALHPRRTPETCRVLHVNLDFRVATNEATARGSHRFWIGTRTLLSAVEVLISTEAISLRAGETIETIRSLRPNQWHSFQLTLDLDARTVSGSVGAPDDVVTFVNKPFSPAWNGTIDFVAIDSRGHSTGGLPGIELDNLGVQDSPLPPVSNSIPSVAATATEPDPTALTEQLKNLAGLDGDFELQADDMPPAKPWHPGPNSVVKISSAAQSPYRNLFGPGQLGVRLPRSGAYNGFGQTLTNVWKADKTDRLFASFDFRCASEDAGEAGSWRFYLGHGPGTSAAVELFLNAREFFRRSADTRDAVRSLRVGEWYQVQLALDLKEKRYTGLIATPTEQTEFTGQFAGGWDGSIDYTFIDSYGHIEGVKPALDADNFYIAETPVPPLNGPPARVAETERESRRAKAGELRRQLAELQADAEKAKLELNALLAEGPFELAYGVVEGTPGNARIQMRGEPDKPGHEVPRGFLKVLGGGALPEDATGSGRLELAQWLTRSENPLTARVMVNRLWQYHFGQGLVKTPNDFGTRGQPPTHPELLDHLASRFIQSGWSIKAMHRLLMLSATYQQAGKYSVVSNQYSVGAGKSSAVQPITDSLNTDYFTSFARRRLSAEETRDSILLVSGELDATPGHGHPFPTPTGWGYTQHGPFNAVYDHNKRSVYLMTQRLKRHPFLALFDGADPNASTAERRATTVPTQALFFLNDPFVHAKAGKFAARLESACAEEARQIELAYRLALGRSPAESARAEATEFLAAYRAELVAARKDQAQGTALAAFARVLFGSNEFLHVD